MGCTMSKSGSAARSAAEHKVGQRRHGNLEARLETLFKSADRDQDQSLSFKEVKRLVHKINLEVPERELKAKFESFDANGDGRLNFDEFRELFLAVESLPNLDTVFRAAAGGADHLLPEDLQRYLVSSSRNRLQFSVRECARLILKHEGAEDSEIARQLNMDDHSDDHFVEGPLLSYEGFLRLMTNPEINSIMDQTKYYNVYQDMRQPLSHYYVSSSHNTYLTGNQLSSESSASAVERALKLGVRVIELDAWDGGSVEEGPIVNHGRTMCRPCTLKSCLEVIKDRAFQVTEYPVVITIENHCSIPFQKEQVRLLEEAFGTKLYMWPGTDGDDGKKNWAVGPPEWASPEDLKGMVVIRDKPQKKSDRKKSKAALEAAAKAKLIETANDPDTHLADALAADGSTLNPDHDLVQSPSSASSTGSDDDESEDFDYARAVELGVDNRLLRAMYIKNVQIKTKYEKDRVVYTEPPYRSSSSLGEGKMLKLAKPGYHARDLAHYAERHIVRVFPAGTRVDSSNYDPTVAWNAGCQVVALNYQTKSMPVWLSQGKFSDNGGCGFVLKPDFLLPAAARKSGTATKHWDAKPKDVEVTLTIRVLSGHYFPKPPGQSDKSEVIDPYVEVCIFGAEPDQSKASTKHVSNNGFNPVWNETFTFQVREPELALVAFVVSDHDRVGKDDFIAQRVVPMTAMVPGYKMVPMLHENSAPQDSYLFVHVDFDPSPPVSSCEPLQL